MKRREEHVPLFEISTLLCESRGQNLRHEVLRWLWAPPSEGTSLANGVCMTLSERNALSGLNYVRTECFVEFSTVDLLSSAAASEVCVWAGLARGT